MDKESLKRKLHEQIDAIDDEQALQTLHEAAIDYSNSQNIEGELNAEQLKRLQDSIEQLNKGKWKSNEEVVKLSRTWLQK